MTDRSFPFLPISRAAHGPKALSARIVCSHCRATDEVVLGDRRPGPWIAKRFAAAGWTVGRRAEDDLCPACGTRRQRKDLPMVATKPVPTGEISQEAIIARKVVHDLLFEHLDIPAKRFRGGWSDERIAGEAKMSAKFVVEFREKLFFKLAADPEPARFVEATAALGRLLADLDGALGEVGKATDALRTAEAKAHTLTKAIAERVRGIAAEAGR